LEGAFRLVLVPIKLSNQRKRTENNQEPFISFFFLFFSLFLLINNNNKNNKAPPFTLQLKTTSTEHALFEGGFVVVVLYTSR